MYPARLLDGVLPNNKQFSYKLMFQYMIVMQRSLSIGVKLAGQVSDDYFLLWKFHSYVGTVFHSSLEKDQGDHYELTIIYCFAA